MLEPGRRGASDVSAVLTLAAVDGPQRDRAQRRPAGRPADRAARRTRLLLLALRPAARPRLPVLCHRGHRHRPGRGPARADGRRAPRCSCSASPPCSSPAGRCSATSARRSRSSKGVLSKVLGVLMILMGVFFMGLMPWLTQREFRFHRRPVAGLVGAPRARRAVRHRLDALHRPHPRLRAGALLRRRRSAGRGAILTVAYCLGLGVPFVLAAVAFRKALGAFGWVKRHYVWVMRIGGTMMIVTGLLLLTGAWDRIVAGDAGLVRRLHCGDLIDEQDQAAHPTPAPPPPPRTRSSAPPAPSCPPPPRRTRPTCPPWASSAGPAGSGGS